MGRRTGWAIPWRRTVRRAVVLAVLGAAAPAAAASARPRTGCAGAPRRDGHLRPHMGHRHVDTAGGRRRLADHRVPGDRRRPLGAARGGETCRVGTVTGVTASTPAYVGPDACTVHGLTPGDTYTFTVTATNATGRVRPRRRPRPSCPRVSRRPATGWWAPTAVCSPSARSGFFGSTGDLRLVRRAGGGHGPRPPTTVALAEVASDGGVFAFGDAGSQGSIPGIGIRSRRAPVAGPTPSTPRSWPSCPPRTAAATSWWPPTAGCSPSATPDSPGRPGDRPVPGRRRRPCYRTPPVTATGWSPRSALRVPLRRRPPAWAPRVPRPSLRHVGRPHPRRREGYRILSADGAVYASKRRRPTWAVERCHGSRRPGHRRCSPPSDGTGYWVVTSDGGRAGVFGDRSRTTALGAPHLNGSIVAVAGF